MYQLPDLKTISNTLELNYGNAAEVCVFIIK